MKKSKRVITSESETITLLRSIDAKLDRVLDSRPRHVFNIIEDKSLGPDERYLKPNGDTHKPSGIKSPIAIENDIIAEQLEQYRSPPPLQVANTIHPYAQWCGCFSCCAQRLAKGVE